MVKNTPAIAGDVSSIPGSGRSPREGNGNPLQYSCLGNAQTEEPGGYSPWGCKRVRHILVTKPPPPTDMLTALGLEGEGEVTQSYPTLCDPVDCSLSGFSVHGILQARILEWVTISFSRGSSLPRDRTQVSCIGGRCFNL